VTEYLSSLLVHCRFHEQIWGLWLFLMLLQVLFVGLWILSGFKHQFLTFVRNYHWLHSFLSEVVNECRELMFLLFIFFQPLNLGDHFWRIWLQKWLLQFNSNSVFRVKHLLGKESCLAVSGIQLTKEWPTIRLWLFLKKKTWPWFLFVR